MYTRNKKNYEFYAEDLSYKTSDDWFIYNILFIYLIHILIPPVYTLFGMHKPRSFVIKCKPNVNFCTMSIVPFGYQFISIYVMPR